MRKKTQRDAQNLVAALQDTKVTRNVAEVVKAKDELDVLKTNIFDFFSNRIAHIETSESLKQLVQSKIEEKIEDDVLEFPDIMQVFRLLHQETSVASEQILNLFKPVAGASSPIMASIANKAEKEDPIDAIHDEMTPNDLEAIDSLIKYLQKNPLQAAEGEDKI